MVFSEEGRCFRMVHNVDGTGRPDHCSEPVAWKGTHRLKGGKRIPVWSCDGHRSGVDNPQKV